MRRAQGRRKILPRTPAWINKSAISQPLPRGKVGLMTPALHIRSKRPTQIRPFIPIDAEPSQIFIGRIGILPAAAIRIEVLHPHYEHTIGIPRPFPRLIKRSRMAHMQITGR